VQVGSEGTERRVERDLIGKAATAGSGGVATKSIAHAGGGTLQGRQTSKVGGPAGGGPSLAEVEREAKGSKRTGEEIKLAFDANKSAIFGIYRRALRSNPLLEGSVVFKLTVDPSGQVTACSIVSSDLKDRELEEKLVARIQLINFGTRPRLETWTGNFKMDFLPSG
jgi:TonB family protein